MKLITKYITKEFFQPFLFGTLAFTFIIFGGTTLFHYIELSVEFNIPFFVLIQLLILKLPAVVAISLPMATLLGSVLAFGRLGNDLEILAFRSCGISLLRLTIPIIITGFLLSIMLFWFNESIVPKAEFSSEILLNQYKTKIRPKIQENINYTQYENNLPKRIINVAKVKEDTYHNITVAEFEEGTLNTIIRSKSGKWNKEGNWEFYDGILYNIKDIKKNILSIINFKSHLIYIQINPSQLLKKEKALTEMNRSELKKQIENKKKSGENTTKDLINYHMRLSLSFACLIYALLGTAVGLKPHRSSSALGFGISLLFIFLYLMLLFIGMSLGLSQILPPIIAVWLPNTIIGLLSLFFLKKNTSQ